MQLAEARGIASRHATEAMMRLRSHKRDGGIPVAAFPMAHREKFIQHKKHAISGLRLC